MENNNKNCLYSVSGMFLSHCVSFRYENGIRSIPIWRMRQMSKHVLLLFTLLIAAPRNDGNVNNICVKVWVYLFGFCLFTRILPEKSVLFINFYWKVLYFYCPWVAFDSDKALWPLVEFYRCSGKKGIFWFVFMDDLNRLLGCS